MSDTGPVTVAVEGLEITSNTATADEMVESLKPADKEEEKQPRVIKPIPDKVPDAKLSKAAAKLGEAGGRAAAEARKAAAAEPRIPDSEQVKPGEETPEGERPLGKPRDDPRARMLEATRQAAELKRQLAERDAYIAGLREREAPPQQQQEEPQPRRSTLPFKPEDFAEYEEYLDARDEYRKNEWQQEVQRQASIDQIVHRIHSIIDENSERAVKVWPTVEDYEAAVAEEIRTLVPSYAVPQGYPLESANVLCDEMQQSEEGPHIQAYFSEHLDEFQRLASLPCNAATARYIQREIARIEGRVGAAITAPSAPRGTSKALPPVRTVTGSPVAADPNEISDDMPDDEWLRRRLAQQNGGGATRR